MLRVGESIVLRREVTPKPGKVTNDFILKEFQTLIELKGEDLQARIENQAYLDFYRELEGEFISRVVSGEITLTNVKGEHKELLEQLLTELGPEIKSEMEREIAPEIKDLKIEIEAEKENK